MSARMLALLGGPESGKTTYLGALVDALETGSLRGLERIQLPHDTRPLERLTEPLLDGRYPQRTTKGERFSLDLALRYRRRDESPFDFSLNVGDYDGEQVERLFKDRIDGWSAEWRTRSEASALLLMLRPDAIVPLPLLQRRPQPDRPQKERRAPFGSDPTTVFGPGLAAEEVPKRRSAAPDEPIRIPIPTVLALIEMLQFIRHARGLALGERPPTGGLRVAVLFSAWDAIDKSWRTRSPADYLSQHMPLLVDFLWSNFHASDVMHFGLSTTGGDLHDSRHRKRYLKNPGGFIVWSDATGQLQQSPDLALPIRWALFGDAAMRDDP
jgi:hypothetical protein